MENSSDYIQKIIDEINDHLLNPEKTEVHLKIFGFYNSLDKLIEHCFRNPGDTKISLQLNELWYVVEDLHNGVVFRRYIRPDENGYLWEYEVDPDDRQVLSSKNLGKHELSRDDKIIFETIERGEERINNERKELGITEPFKTHGIHIGDFTKREKYNICSRLDSFMDHEKWAYDRRDSSCQNITTIYQRFENLGLPRTAHLKYEDYVSKIALRPNPDIKDTSLDTDDLGETSSTLTIGELTAEQTKDLFELVNGVVFEKTRLEDFAESLNNPERNKLQLKNKTLAAGFFNFWDSYFGSDNNKDAMISALGYIKAYKKNGGELNVSKKQVNFINQVKETVRPNNPNLSERK